MNINNNILLIKKGDVIEKSDLTNPVVSFTPKADSLLECFLIVFDGNVNITVDLEEEGASCSLNVLYLADKEHHVDIALKVNHLAYNTKSTQIIKGIATDKSKVSFEGNIYIDNKAQKSDGIQNHRALLLSDEAVVQAVPALEIYADDVKCEHGSATGPLDETALFYLLSRGIPPKTAKKILLESFISKMIPEQYLYVTKEWIEENV